MTAFYLFGSTFILVFALGFQSLNVNGGHYLLAFLTSFVIGLANLVLYKALPGADLVESIAFLSGGPLGIVASMVAHRRFVTRGRTPDFLDRLDRLDKITKAQLAKRMRAGVPPARNPPPPTTNKPHRRVIR